VIEDSNTVPPDAPQAPPEPAANGADPDPGPGRALTLHLLRMLETRMDAAGVALTNEVQTFTTRLQLKVLAAALVFIAVWGGIVLLAVALPDPYRVPVLGGVVLLFVGVAIWALLASKRRGPADEIGSLRWFLDGLKLDLEVLSRSLHPRPEAPAPRAPEAPTYRPPESVQ
jgi:uncharacterized membrane protein YqjE